MSRNLNSLIRTIPDFPKPGISFKDITPLIANGDAFLNVSKQIAQLSQECDYIAGIEARGFIFASSVCALTGKGFIPIRKSGKLPGETISSTYDLEYGTATLEIHTDIIKQGSKVLVVDDVLATGGTAIAATKLLTTAGLIPMRLVFLLAIPELNGMARIAEALPDLKTEVILAQ
ncbi:MAG: adenine phosphoribosyltransferase [Candidatus Nanopelagicus sp.]